MTAYYNEFDPKAAAWIRELIKMKLITDGEVDDRSITEVTASDIRGFRRQHFFAGIAGWERALQLAGWADDRPVCTASLPCQPFSVAGAGKGVDDERHLLPHFIELVKQCNFKTIIGEQVPAAIRHGWIDDLQAAMEAEGYAVGFAVLGAHSAGAPHIRQRLYWVANSHGIGRNGGSEGSEQEAGECARINIRSAHDDGVADVQSERHERRQDSAGKTGRLGIESACGEWNNPEWIYCRDNKYRPIKPGIKPLVRKPEPSSIGLADGLPEGVVRCGDTGESIDADNTQEARVMRLKGYGNAICVPVSASFIKAFMETQT